MLNSEVERYEGDPKTALVCLRWRFWVGDNSEVYLDTFSRMERPSPRHKFRSVHTYERIPYSSNPDLLYDEVPLPEDVKEEAIENLKKQFKFAGEYKRRRY